MLCERDVEARLTNPWGVETRMYGWGFGRHGQLGTDMIVHMPTPHKVKMPKWERVVDISAGKSHSCALTVYGQLYTWGKGWFGVLGHGDDQMKIAPTLLETTKNMILKVSAGLMHTTALSLRRGGLSRRAVERSDRESTMRGTPPVYLGLPKKTANATKIWMNARCLSNRIIEAGKEGEGEEDEESEEEKEQGGGALLLDLLGSAADDEDEGKSGDLENLLMGSAESAPTPKARKSGGTLKNLLEDTTDAAPTPKVSTPRSKIVFGKDPPGVTRAAWGDEEKKIESEPPPTSMSPLASPTAPTTSSPRKALRHSRERTWRDLTPDEWYKRSTKTQVFYKCDQAKFTCLSYHCARQCMNGQQFNRTRLLKRAEARLANQDTVKKNIEDLREEGHTEGDVKRFIQQFARREQRFMKEIDEKFGRKPYAVEVSDAPLAQISQCSLTEGCRLLQCIPEVRRRVLRCCSELHRHF